MRVLTAVGARPQFIKAAPVSRVLRQQHTEFLVHTGQHYDYEMSQIFFEEMDIPTPDVYLGIGSGSHGQQTGLMLMRLEEVMLDRQPDWVLVYGDTNSTLAAALAAVKLHIPVAHVEAGLRSFNRIMPEEHNRVLTDHCSDLLFCPTRTATKNLRQEGIARGIHLVGDTMFDAALQFVDIARGRSKILQDLGLKPKEYLLATVHRPYNTDVPANLGSILSAFREIGERIVFPIHPRTRQRITEYGLNDLLAKSPNVQVIEPVGYLHMLLLEQNARLILTDSGGMQKEAYFFEVPCVTLRPETEWVETVTAGWNVAVGADKQQIIAAVTRGANHDRNHDRQTGLFGNGQASQQIVRILEETEV